MTEQTIPTSTTSSPQAASARGLRKERVGLVVSTKMKKTAVVETTTRVPHAKFGKIVKQVKRFYAHDEDGKAQTGDTVRIAETRPLSKLKRWRLIEILKH
jgi:small subunit ribosomal protein S17